MRLIRIIHDYKRSYQFIQVVYYFDSTSLVTRAIHSRPFSYLIFPSRGLVYCNFYDKKNSLSPGSFCCNISILLLNTMRVRSVWNVVYVEFCSLILPFLCSFYFFNLIEFLSYSLEQLMILKSIRDESRDRLWVMPW